MSNKIIFFTVLLLIFPIYSQQSSYFDLPCTQVFRLSSQSTEEWLISNSERHYWYNDEWRNDNYINYTYDENNILIEELTLYWNLDSSGWINSVKDSYNYDDTNNEIEYIYESWVESYNYWKKRSRTVITCINLDGTVQKLEQRWVGTHWKNDELHLNTTDQQNRPVLTIIKDWNDSAWKNWRMIELEYDANQNLIDSTHYQWNNDSWIEWQNWSFTYDQSNNRIETLSTFLGMNDMKILHIYDDSDNMVEQITQFYLYGMDDWLNYKKITIDYVENGIPSEQNQYSWEDSVWNSIEKNIYSYDEYLNLSENIILVKHNDNWINSERLIYNYVQLETVSDKIEILPDGINIQSVYPNPFNSKASINYIVSSSTNVAVKIFDIGGRLVSILYEGKQHEGDYTIEWNSSMSPSGIYIIQLETKYSIQTEKVILLK